MQLKDRHARYLGRTARGLSSHLGRRVSPDEVLQAVIDMAICDEGVYDLEDGGRLISADRREVVQAARKARTLDLSPEELLKRISLPEESQS